MAQAENAKKLDYTPVTYDDQYILMVNQLKKYFPIKGGLMSQTVGHVKAVDGVTFNLKRGHTMGLVGESGCGKSTTGRTILRLAGEKTGGQVLFNGKEVYDMTGRELRNLRTKMQIIFQDPFSSLSPRLPVGEIIGEAVREHNLVPKNEFDDYIDQVMDDCGLQPYHKTRYPHEFSGGQRQRICIARALALNPEFVVCDEPVSALDVSIQAQIINLLKALQDKYNLTYLFISHDLSVVEHISDTVGVMYLGNLVEYGATPDIFSHPLHPYTKALFSAIPIPDPTIRRERHCTRNAGLPKQVEEDLLAEVQRLRAENDYLKICKPWFWKTSDTSTKNAGSSEAKAKTRTQYSALNRSTAPCNFLLSFEADAERRQICIC